MNEIITCHIEKHLANVNDEDIHALPRKITAIHEELAVLAKTLEDASEAKVAMLKLLGELEGRMSMLDLVKTAVNDSLTDFSCGMKGFMTMLDGLEEKKMNAMYLLLLLAPLQRQFQAAYSALCVATD